MNMVIGREKQEIRQRLLAKLLSLTKDEIKRRSNNVGKKLSNLSIYKKAKVILVYYPLKGEVDIRQMIREDLAHKRFCFPVMDLKAKILRIFEVNSLDDDFVPGPFGVMEPDTEKTKEVNVSEIEIVIVPGLAFDLQKNRLGRGAGFYDRFLKKINPNVKKVGIAFNFQILKTLPIHLSLDQSVDLVISEDFVV